MEKKRTSLFKVLKERRIPANVLTLRSSIEVADATANRLVFTEVLGVWDTGATSCAISQKKATEIGLISRTLKKVEGVNSNTPKSCNTFYLKVKIEDYLFEDNFEVTAMEYGGVDFLIGLDLIRKGHLSLKPVLGGELDFLFEIPISNDPNKDDGNL